MHRLSLVVVACACAATFAQPLTGLGLLPSGVPSGAAGGPRFDMAAGGLTFVKGTYRWQSGSWQTLNPGTGRTFTAHGVSGDGAVVVGEVVDSLAQPFATSSSVAWRSNVFNTLESSQTFLGQDVAVFANNDGSVILAHHTDVGQGFLARRRFSWNGTSYINSSWAVNDDLGQNFGSADEQGYRGISDLGTAALGYNIGPLGNDTYATRLATSAGPAFDRPASITFPSSGINVIFERAFPTAISGNGNVIIGRYEWSVLGSVPSSGDSPFRWTAAGGTVLVPAMPLGTEMDFDGEFTAAGAVIYNATTNTALPVATFLTGFGVNVSGWSSLNCTEISSDGLTFSGIGSHTTSSGTVSEIWYVTIPSPTSATLCLAGLAAGLRRRR